MKKPPSALLLSLALAIVGCGKPVDPAELIAKLTALNERTCACKDVACVEAASLEHGKLQDDVHKVEKDKETLSKLAELQIKHNDCVEQSMAAQGFK